MFVQIVADQVVRGRIGDAVRTAQRERVELTTPQPAPRA
jgi:hypothetical protein